MLTVVVLILNSYCPYTEHLCLGNIYTSTYLFVRDAFISELENHHFNLLLSTPLYFYEHLRPVPEFAGKMLDLVLNKSCVNMKCKRNRLEMRKTEGQS